MKPKLSHKIPLQSNLSASQAIGYIEYYRYLEHYNFGPYYIDTLTLIGIRIVCLEHIDAAFKIKHKPLLEAYVNRRYPDKNFFPSNATNIIWATYEHIYDDGNGNTTFIKCEGSLTELLEKYKQVVKSEHIQSFQDATKLVERFSDLVNNCIVLPGNYILTDMRIVSISAINDMTPAIVSIFAKDKHNKGSIKPDSFAVIATISANAGEHGYNYTKDWFLCDLLDQHKIKMITKKD